jgi:hypothetical protein
MGLHPPMDPGLHLTGSGDQSGNGNYQLAQGVITMDLGASSPGGAPYSESDTAHTRVRFDTCGTRAGKVRGAVFTDAKVIFTLSLSDAAVDESARHIDDAFRTPTRTFPSFVGKTVPGNASGTQPLHREWDDEKINNNRTASVNLCKNIMGAYDGTKK